MPHSTKTVSLKEVEYRSRAYAAMYQWIADHLEGSQTSLGELLVARLRMGVVAHTIHANILRTIRTQGEE